MADFSPDLNCINVQHLLFSTISVTQYSPYIPTYLLFCGTCTALQNLLTLSHFDSFHSLNKESAWSDVRCGAGPWNPVTEFTEEEKLKEAWKEKWNLAFFKSKTKQLGPLMSINWTLNYLRLMWNEPVAKSDCNHRWRRDASLIDCVW